VETPALIETKQVINYEPPLSQLLDRNVYLRKENEDLKSKASKLEIENEILKSRTGYR